MAKISRYQNVLLLAFVALTFFFLRLYRLPFIPKLYPDEISNIDVARSFWSGRPTMIGIYYPFFTQLPLYFLVSAIGLFFSPINDFLTLRYLSVFYSSFAVLLAYLISLKFFKNKWLALAPVLLLAIDPYLIIFNRYAFSRNLYCSLVLLLALLTLSHKESPSLKFFFLIALLVGLMSLSDIYLWPYLVIVFLVTLLKGRSAKYAPRQYFLFVALASLPLIFYVVWGWANFGPAFFKRIFYLISVRGGLDSSLPGAYLNGLADFLNLTLKNPLLVLGLLYCLLPFPKKTRYLDIFTVVILLSIILVSARDASLHERIKIIYYPFLYIGFAGILAWFMALIPRLKKEFLILITFLLIIFQAPKISVALGGGNNFMDTYGIWQPEEASAVAEYINSHHIEGKVSVIEASLSWQIKGNKAVITQLLFYQGIDTTFYPKEIRDDRYFIYPLDLDNLDYAVLGEFTKKIWTVHQPGAKNLIDYFQSNWIKVFSAGEYEIYKNPKI